MLGNPGAQENQFPSFPPFLPAFQKGPAWLCPKALLFLTQHRGAGTSDYNSVALYFATMMPVFTSAMERGTHTLPCVPGLQVGTSKTTAELLAP